MQPIVTDRVAWSVSLSVGLSVYLSVCYTSEPCKNGCIDRDAVWVGDSGLGSAQGTMYWMGVQIPSWEGAILRGKGRPIVKYRDTLQSSV